MAFRFLTPTSSGVGAARSSPRRFRPTSTSNGQMRRFFLRAHLDEHTGDLAPIDLDVVGQFDRGFERKFVTDRLGNSFGCPKGESRGAGDVDLGSQQD